MAKRGIWKVIDEKNIPINCLLFQLKRNEIFRARLVACGYIHAPGIDFNESFSIILNGVSFRIMLIIKFV
jgi:hypothetical protein